MNELTHVDLFSGIGGFCLAAGWAGFRTVAFSEVEPYACKVLAQRWPGVPNVGDVRIAANFARFRGATVLTGGFPCQPWSAAGKRGGANDDRHLWPAMLRVIETVRPSWIIGENVPGLDHMGQLDACCDDLAALGYESQPFEIPACAVDAPHLRDRLWIVANASGRRFGGPGCGEDEQPRRAETVGGSEDVADADRARELQQSGRIGEIGQRISDCGEALADASRILEGRPEQRSERERAGAGGESGIIPDPDLRRRQEREIARRPGKSVPLGHGDRARLSESGSVENGENGRDERRAFTSTGRWLPEPGVGRVAHGVSNRAHRLKGLGNAIVPQVVAPFFRWIKEIEMSTAPTVQPDCAHERPRTFPPTESCPSLNTSTKGKP